MTVLDYLKKIGVEVKPMCIKVDELKDYIGRPVWSSHEAQWRIVDMVEYKEEIVRVYFTDGRYLEFFRELQETWLQKTDGR